MKVCTVVGARPQFIKAAAVSRVLRAAPGGITEVIVHTGQHYDQNMSDVFFSDLGVPKPEYQLGLGGGSHGAMTGRMLEAIEEVLLQEHPDWLLVYGDTNSTLAGALAAAKLQIPVAHVEAGLRSFNRRMPEEINRVLTDHISDVLFAPTNTAVQNLLNEGLPAARILLTGDVMFDVALDFGEKANRESHILQEQGLSPGRYLLTTVHRAENTDHQGRLQAIVEGLVQVSMETSIPVVMPLHPRTRGALERYGLLATADGTFRVLEPVGYLDMAQLERNASVIVTDSGGIQKEAFFYHVPCVTLRDETEWVELLELGWNRLVSPHTAEHVAAGVMASLRGKSGRNSQPYGDGHSAERIVARLLNGESI